MRKWQCVVCGFVYDEHEGLASQEIEPGTSWQQLPADWVCPDCGTVKREFVLADLGVEHIGLEKGIKIK